MSTVVTFAGNLVDDPQLLHTRENRPFVVCRVLVDRRVQDAAGGWVDGEPTAHDVKVYGSAATNLYDSAGRGHRIIVHGLMRTEAWPDKETGDKRTRNIVEVTNSIGEVGPSLRWDLAPVEKPVRSSHARPEAHAATAAS